jgi:poly(3-hydroxyoctanoate) depolymerase
LFEFTTHEIAGHQLRIGTRPGYGTALLLANGLGAPMETWEPSLEALGDRPLIAFDAPGIGGSKRPARPFRLSAIAALAWEVADRLGRETVDVLGCSLGGAVAQEMAHQQGSRVRRLVLVGTFPGLGGVPGPPHVLASMLHPLRFSSRAYFERIVPRCLGGAVLRDPSILAVFAKSGFGPPHSPVGHVLGLLALQGWTSVPWLHRVESPTLVLHGDDDRLVPVSNAHLMHSRLANSTLHLVRGGGHLMMLDQVDDTLQPVCEFLDAA